MSRYQVTGLDHDLSLEVRTTLRSPQYGHPAHVEVAAGYGPCRSCLRTFAEGVDERILFTYQPFSDPGAVPLPGPVFIHRDACDRYVGDRVPDTLAGIPLWLEGFGDQGQLLAAEAGGDDPSAHVGELLKRAEVKYVHIRNREAGCFVARAALFVTAPHSTR